MSLRLKTINGLKWTALESIILQIVQFILGIVMARLLSPKDFGLMGIVIIFTAVSDTIVNSGFSQGLIRKVNVCDDDFKTAYILNTSIAFFIYTLLFFSSGYLSEFFSDSRLTDLLKLGGISIILNSFTLVQKAYLTRNMEFQLQTKFSIGSSLTSGLLGIISAYYGFGVYSLIIRSLSQAFMSALLYWSKGLWKPSGKFSLNSFKEQFAYGSKLLISSLLETLYQNVYSFVIAKFYSKSELGLYSRAQQFQAFITVNMMNVVGKTSFPSLSAIQDDQERFKLVFKKMTKITMLIASGSLFTLFNSSNSLVAVLLGNKWMDSVIYLNYLSLLGFFYPIAVLNLSVLQIKGRSDLYLALEVVKKLFAIPVILTGIYFGIENMLRVSFFTGTISFLVNSHFTQKLIDYSTYNQITDVLPYLVFGGISSIFVIVLTSFVQLNDMGNLALSISGTLAVFFIGMKIYDPTLLSEVKTILINMKG